MEDLKGYKKVAGEDRARSVFNSGQSGVQEVMFEASIAREILEVNTAR